VSTASFFNFVILKSLQIFQTTRKYVIHTRKPIFPKNFPSFLPKNPQSLLNKSHGNHEQSLNFEFCHNQKFGEFFQKPKNYSNLHEKTQEFQKCPNFNSEKM